MHNASERFAKFLTTIIQIVLLVSLFGSTATYFVGHPITLSDLGLTSAIDLGVAISFESATWLFQRLLRGLWQQLATMDDTAEDYERTRSQFKLYIGITASLMVMSAFYYGSFIVAVHHGPITPAEWFAIILRAVTTPALLFVLSFTSKLAHDANDLLANASHTMLVSTTKATIKQWKRRIKLAQKRKIDLAPIAMSLMEQEGHHSAAKRIRIIAEGLDAAEGIKALPNPLARLQVIPASAPALAEMPRQTPQVRLSDDQLSDRLRNSGFPERPTPMMNLSFDHLPERAPLSERETPEMSGETGADLYAKLSNAQTAKTATARSSKRASVTSSGRSATGRKPYPIKDTRNAAQKEADCRRIIEEVGGVDNISQYELAKRAKVSTSTAAKWHKAVQAGE